ncbi:MAG: primosomal protein N' [Bdellovibrionaceae bacterium]|jgi:primosomal protein N' (replication factor Y) (superfamily II helicase)|nr:primosomal protein N' [Pseudobdellovibrionaceae bacterium]
MAKNYIVAINAAIDANYTYSFPEPIGLGTAVFVPLRNTRRAKGVIISDEAPALDDKIKIKSIIEANPDRPVLPIRIIKWAKWLSDYYQYPLGLVLESCFAPLKPATKTRKTHKNDIVPSVEKMALPDLTGEQKQCLSGISQNPHFNVHLLFGVTGSGKTEVYLRLLEQSLSQGKTAIVIVPEISLTPQIVKRFSERFPDEVALIHSHLTPREKTNQWWLAVNGKKKILIGARSALFCPVESIGLIIVDEEHEASFKQDEKLKYNGRDAAIMLAKLHNCPIVLGSATPSIESWNNAKTGRYKLHEMTKRVENRSLPNVHIVDLKDEESKDKKKQCTEVDLPFWLSFELYEAIQKTLIKKEQVALFLNRRGMAQTTLCSDCGFVYECPNCSISLTLHASNQLHCHYCDYGISLKTQCPSCFEPSIKPIGIGTEQVQNDMHTLFPEANIERADRDEITTREDLEKLIENMEEGRTDILVGTQMIAKGLDFPKLTLVGLVLADVGMNMPDFRSSERSFQLITQVSGRSGRHSELPGDVFIQTYNPDHLSIEYAKKANYVDFANTELEFRSDAQYPPFSKLVCFKITGLFESKVKDTARILADRAHLLKQKFEIYNKIQVLGPSPAPILRIKGKYRYMLLIKATDFKVVSPLAKQLLGSKKWIPAQTKVQIDVDPLNML